MKFKIGDLVTINYENQKTVNKIIDIDLDGKYVLQNIKIRPGEKQGRLKGSTFTENQLTKVS